MRYSMSRVDERARRHPRFHVDVQAYVHTGTGRRLGARTRDLSRSGICLITCEGLAPGDILHVELVLLLGGSSESEPLPVRARVVWCTPIAHEFQIGAMFDGMSRQQASFLDMFLRYLDGSLLPAGAEMEEAAPSAIVDDPSVVDVVDADDDDDPFRP